MANKNQAPTLYGKGEKLQDHLKWGKTIRTHELEMILMNKCSTIGELKLMFLLTGNAQDGSFNIPEATVLDRCHMGHQAYINSRTSLAKKGWITYIQNESITVNYNVIFSEYDDNTSKLKEKNPKYDGHTLAKYDDNTSPRYDDNTHNNINNNIINNIINPISSNVALPQAEDVSDKALVEPCAKAQAPTLEERPAAVPPVERITYEVEISLSERDIKLSERDIKYKINQMAGYRNGVICEDLETGELFIGKFRL